jgi:soluble lytic murein transglycosylase
MASQYPRAIAAGAVAAVLAAAPAAAEDNASLAWLSQTFALYDTGSGMLPGAAPSGIAGDLALWDLLRRPARVGMAPVPLAVQAAFITGHPEWPALAAIRRRGEAQAADPLTPDADALAYFRIVAPETPAGQARFAMLTGGPAALALARGAWVRPGLSPDQELALLARYAGQFAQADHAARADRLLWAGQTAAAQRLLSWLDDDVRALTRARIALRSGTADAEALFASVPARVRRDPGLLFDRSVWLERRGRLSDAEAVLAHPDIGDGGVSAPEPWLERRLALGRAAMRRGDNATAYQLLANHKSYAPATDVGALPLAQRIDLSDTEWLAGWISLRRLGRADAAVDHFNRFLKAVNTPVSLSRGYYWLGRAEKLRGNGAAAARAFRQAAQYFDCFYGQLAAEETGAAVSLPAAPAELPAAERRAFEDQPLVQALLLLNRMDSRARETLFIRAIARAVDDPSEAQAAAALGQTIGRPDLGVWIWRETRPRGDVSAFATAYPALPPNAPVPGRDWILSHAIARQESSFDRTAVSSAGARGLMQLMPATARDVARRIGQPFDAARLTEDPVYNVTLGSYYIGMRRDELASVMLAIAAYNAGAGNVRNWLVMNGDPRTTTDPVDWVEMIPFAETRGYVQRVIENAVVYSLRDPQRAGANPRPSAWLRGG